MSRVLAIGPGRGVTKVLLPEHLEQDHTFGSANPQTKSPGILRCRGIARVIARLTNPQFKANKNAGGVVSGDRPPGPKKTKAAR